MNAAEPARPSSDRLAVAIHSDPNDDQLSALLKEYELTETSLEGTSNRIIEIVGVGTGVLGLVAGFVLTQQKNLPLGIAWISPFVFFMFFALVVFNTYNANSKVWNLRILSWRINDLISDGLPVRESSLISYERNAPSGVFFSTGRGNWKVRIVYLILIAGSVVLFLATVLASFQEIFSYSHIQGTLFLFANLALTFFGLTATSGVFFDLHDYFESFLRHCQTTGHIPDLTTFDAKVIHRNTFYSFIQFVVPRDWDFLVKFIYVVYGMIVALAAVGLQPDQLPMLNFLFGGDKQWLSVTQVPLWPVLCLGAIYLIIEELLLQQAKLIWDDIRDVERDKLLPLNSMRALASGKMSRRSAVAHMLVRWVLAFMLGYLVGGLPLLVLFIIISFHQVIYELWSKPNAGNHPLLALFVLSFNIALRFLAGAMAIVGSHWTFSPVVYVFVLFYLASLGGMATIWKLEGQGLIQRGEDAYRIKPQSRYFASEIVARGKRGDREKGTGVFWQHVGLSGAVAYSASLVVVHVNVCANVVPLASTLYGRCVGGSSVAYLELGVLRSLAVIGALIMAYVVISCLLVLLSDSLGFLNLTLLLLVPFIGGGVSQHCSVGNTSVDTFTLRCDNSVGFGTPFSVALDPLMLSGAALLALLLVILLFWLMRKLSMVIVDVGVKGKGLFLPLLTVLSLVAFILTFVEEQTLFLYLGLLLLQISYLLLYERMTYDEYSLEEFRRRLPFITKVWIAYFFAPDPRLSLARLLIITFSPDANVEDILSKDRERIQEEDELMSSQT